ncbi:hypothetical protein ACET3Z_009142 [Daucus carota]
MFAKTRDTTLAQDDDISKNIMGLARTRPDIFGTTEEEGVLTIGRTATPQAMSQNPNGEEINDVASNLPGPAAPPRPGMPSIRPLPPPANLAAVNIPRPLILGAGVLAPAPPRPPLQVCAPPPPLQMNYGQQPFMVNRPLPLPPSISVNPPSIPMPPPPGSQYTPLTAPRPYAPNVMPQHGMHLGIHPPMPLGIPPPPPLPEEPEPKRKRLGDDSMLIPEDQFLAQHQGPASINVSVPNVDDVNLKGQVLEIRVQSLSETVSSLKEKIAGGIQLPSNKQKLSGKAGFLKDNLSLAYYNVSGGETLSLSLRERGGRKR